jgi:putative hydrolase of the HAD superfamily
MIRTILFDLDNTLYPPGTGIMEEIRVLIHRFVRTHLDLDDDEAEVVRRRYFQVYGTTMRGLQIHHQIDADEFLRFVHEIPLEDYLQPNPSLDSVLAALPQQKIVFTNASREHAERVLRLLAIERHFSRIIDVRDLGHESKPQPAAYRRVCQMLDVRPEECLMVEDNVRNLRPAKALGMATVLVQDGGASPDGAADYVIARVEDIGKVVADTVDTP